MKNVCFSILGRRGFPTSPGQSVRVLLKPTITLVVLSLLTFGPLTTFAQNVPYQENYRFWNPNALALGGKKPPL